jgi:hypothetical protein
VREAAGDHGAPPRERPPPAAHWSRKIDTFSRFGAITRFDTSVLPRAPLD